MKIGGIPYRTVWFQDGKLHLINQPLHRALRLNPQLAKLLNVSVKPFPVFRQLFFDLGQLVIVWIPTSDVPAGLDVFNSLVPVDDLT